LKEQTFDKRLFTFEFMSESRESKLNYTDIFTTPVSIHTPLHQFLASLIVRFNDKNPRERMTGKSSM
jgi:hypothetical protein